jgi:hypothetical protein
VITLWSNSVAVLLTSDESKQAARGNPG